MSMKNWTVEGVLAIAGSVAVGVAALILTYWFFN